MKCKFEIKCNIFFLNYGLLFEYLLILKTTYFFQMRSHNRHWRRLHQHNALPQRPVLALVFTSQGLRTPAPLRDEKSTNPIISW
jgi:hypothetical protein